MTITQLRAVVATAETGSFTSAAKAMGYSQAAVSELVRRLEEECGLQLFVRGGRRLRITPVGSTLLAHARQAVAAVDNAGHAVRSHRQLTGGVASFGLFRNAGFYLLAELGAQFTSAFPDVRVRLVGVNSAVVAHAVAGGELEAGIVVLPVDPTGLDVTPLARDELLYASVDPTHTTAPVDISTMAARRLVLYDAHVGWSDPDRAQLAERAHDAGVRLNLVAEVEEAMSALRLAANGVGDTIISRALAEHSRRTENLQLHTVGLAPPLFNTFAMIRRQGAALSPATEELARRAVDLLLRNPTLKQLHPIHP